MSFAYSNKTDQKKTSVSQFLGLSASLSLGRDLPILPCNPMTKAPMIGGKGGFKLATSDFHQLLAWAEQYPNAMAGLPTGHQTGFWVLDIDNKKDRNGFASLAELERRHGKLSDSMRVRTGSGGQHLYFKMPPGVRIPQRAGDIAAGLDVRGSTGYVIAPGSVLSDEREYQFLDGRTFDDIEPAPLWLIYLAVFGERRREQLAKIGINGPDDLGCEPWAWADRVRELLRIERPRLQGTMTEGRAASIQRYVERAIASEIEAVRGLEDGGRDNGINKGALSIWSLLNGAEEVNVDVNDLADRAFLDFHAACLATGRPQEKADPDAYVEDKWDRARADADPRDLGHVGRADAADEFSDLAVGLTTSTTNRLLFPSQISLQEIADRQANALVSGLLLPGETGTIYGTHSTGKTFVALDLAFAIALGRDWHGRKVKQAPVLYVSLEGVSGFDKRTVAIKQTQSDPGTRFARLMPHVILNKSDAGKKGALEIIEACRDLDRVNGQPVGLVVIDTKARATAGDDENSTTDAAVYQELRTGFIARETGAAVLTVHHESKAGGYRGASAASAGDSLIVRIERLPGVRRATAEKVKDGEEGILFDFDLESVDLGPDANGEIMTSCVVAKTEPKRATADTMSKPERVFRHAFNALEGDGAGEVDNLPGTETPGYRIDLDTLKGAFVTAYAGASASGKPLETATRMWRSVVRKLPSDFASTLEAIWRSRCPLASMK